MKTPKATLKRNYRSHRHLPPQKIHLTPHGEVQKSFLVAVIALALLVVLSLFLFFSGRSVGKAITGIENANVASSLEGNTLHLEISLAGNEVSTFYLELSSLTSDFRVCDLSSEVVASDSLGWDFTDVQCVDNKFILGTATLNPDRFTSADFTLDLELQKELPSREFTLNLGPVSAYRTTDGVDLFTEQSEEVSFCQENWACLAWTPCVDNQQTRTCTDAHTCGTTANQPLLERSCDALVENQLPTAVLQASPQSGMESLPVNFDASASSDADGEFLTYYWQFGDGESSDQERVTHVYTQTGIYTATLTVQDGNEGEDLESLVITVTENPALQVLPPMQPATTGTEQTTQTVSQASSGSGGGGGGRGGGSLTCLRKWDCDDWSTCINGQQSRTCSDVNHCNSTKTFGFRTYPVVLVGPKKPTETQACTVGGLVPSTAQQVAKPPQVQKLAVPSAPVAKPTGVKPVAEPTKISTQLLWIIPSLVVLGLIALVLLLHHFSRKQLVYNYDDLKNWILQEKKMGASEEEIISQIKQHTGWTMQDIQKTFADLGAKGI